MSCPKPPCAGTGISIWPTDLWSNSHLPPSDLQAISSSDKVWSLQPGKGTDGNLLPQKFPAFSWKAVQPAPPQLAQSKGLLGEWVRIGSSVTWALSLSLISFLFSVEKGWKLVGTCGTQEGRSGCTWHSFNGLLEMELWGKQGVIYPSKSWLSCAKVSKNPSCFSDPYHVLRPSVPTNWWAVQSAKHTILTPCSPTTQQKCKHSTPTRSSATGEPSSGLSIWGFIFRQQSGWKRQHYYKPSFNIKL